MPRRACCSPLDPACQNEPAPNPESDPADPFPRWPALVGSGCGSSGDVSTAWPATAVRLRHQAAEGVYVLMLGCDSSVSTPVSPSTPAPAPGSSPRPPAGGIASSVLSGVVFEMTATGRVPVAGATIHLETCSLSNCPDVKGYDVKTDKDGGYRIAGVYDGTMNYLWARDAVYDMVGAMAPGTCPDGCDLLVTVKGETRLDIELVRR